MLQVFNGMILTIVFVELHPFSLAEDYLLNNVNELFKEKSIENSFHKFRKQAPFEIARRRHIGKLRSLFFLAEK